MYLATENGIIKKLETWNLTIPLHDNDGIKFSENKIEEILEYISVTYPGFTIVSCIGLWKDQKQVYKDENYQVIIDTVSSNAKESMTFFSNLKSNLAKKLNQEKIYLTKTNDKEEILSYREFFEEVGLEIDYKNNSNEVNINIAQQIVNSQDFVFKRLAFETVVLVRDSAQNKIIWERNICGVRLKTEFDDLFPKDSIILGADQIDKLGDAIFGKKLIVLIGKYEYQNYILEKFAFKSLVNAELGELNDEVSFRDRQGNPITTKRFVELFSMSIFCNYLALREENYLSNEIKVNVGKDGSMQIGESQVNGNILLHTPAIIKNKVVQIEIIRCVNECVRLFENNKIDAIALLQAKARNNYINNRALIRKQIKNHTN
jgi:hypothetical protein